MDYIRGAMHFSFGHAVRRFTAGVAMVGPPAPKAYARIRSHTQTVNAMRRYSVQSASPMKRVRHILLLCLLVLLGFFLRDAVSFIRELSDGYSKGCSLDVPRLPGVSIDIYTPHSYEVSRPLCYEVRTQEQCRAPMTYFYSADVDEKIAKDSFALITAKGGYLVGVVFASRPHEVVIIHDFTTDESWPKCGYAEEWTSTLKRGEALLDVLRSDSGKPDLRLH